MNFTNEQLTELLRNNPTLAAANPELGKVGSSGTRTHTSSKELNVLDCPKGLSQLEKEMRPKFRVSITLRCSDNRVRDPDAAVSTIFDALIAARRSLADHH